MEGAAGLYLGGYASLSVTNDAVIFSSGVSRVTGLSTSVGFVPFNADKIDGSKSWTSWFSIPYHSKGREFQFSKGAKPELDVTISAAAGWSFHHTLMQHNVYKAN